MIKTFIFSGAGGQGMISIGKFLAMLAVDEGYNASFFPSYGPEMRGGTAHCHVIISDESICSPKVSSDLDYLIAMNQPSYDKFKPIMKSNGKIICNLDLVAGTQDDVCIPMSQIAAEIGSSKSINLIALGALCKELNLFESEKFINLINNKFGENELNTNSFNKGYYLNR